SCELTHNPLRTGHRITAFKSHSLCPVGSQRYGSRQNCTVKSLPEVRRVQIADRSMKCRRGQVGECCPRVQVGRDFYLVIPAEFAINIETERPIALRDWR